MNTNSAHTATVVQTTAIVCSECGQGNYSPTGQGFSYACTVCAHTTTTPSFDIVLDVGESLRINDANVLTVVSAS